MKSVLITGAKGFLGTNVSKHYKGSGYRTYGIGHGKLSIKESKEIGLDYWREDDLSIKAFLEFRENFNVIIHCGGGGSIGYSLDYPEEDYKKTVDGTIEVLEYMRKYNPESHLIYPSSPAVQGEHPDKPIEESYVGEPVSPYGRHKKITEDLCLSYSEEFGLNISIARLFSVYGNGLRKQLLWDACKKISKAKHEVIFWGTGGETRDFIHINDVLYLFDLLIDVKDKFLIINGGIGSRCTTKHIINMIRNLINPNINIHFDNKKNIGNPMYYCADTQKLQNYGFTPSKKLEQGIKNYVDWVRNLND